MKSLTHRLHILFIPIQIFIFVCTIYGQNLIVNPGFELPESEIKYQAIGVFDLNQKVEMTPDKGYNAGYNLSVGWTLPTNGSSDYLMGDNCSAFGWPIMQARTGKGRGGLCLGGKSKRKEYLQVAFKTPLEKNKKYCLSFYIAHEKFSNYAISQVDAYFSNELILANTKRNLDLVPHISLNKTNPITHDKGWIEVCGTYVARGGERYLTVGNFNKEEVSVHVKEIYEDYKENGGKQGFMHPLKNKAYYYVDDFSLTKLSDSTYDCEQWKMKEDAVEKNWIFLLDASGSMASVDKLPNIKLEMQQVSSIIPEGSSLSMVSFGQTNEILLEEADMSESDTITSVLNALKADGGSAITYSFSKTLNLAKRLDQNGKETEIYIFTDGAITGAKVILDTIAEFRENYPNVTINTVQFGTRESNRKSLEKIARKGKGKCYNINEYELRYIFHSNIGLEFVRSIECNQFLDCCTPQKEIDKYSYNNTTFLLDVSNSMKGKDKLPLLQNMLLHLSDSMRVNDELSVVQFSSSAEVVLPNTSYQNKTEIQNIINNLQSKGMTNLEKGIEAAVEQANKSYKPSYTNTIVLATDGKAEFTKKMKKLIVKAQKNNIRTSILHFSDYENKALNKMAIAGGGEYHLIGESNLLEEFSSEIEHKEMGSDFYNFNSTYSAKKKEQISAYRWSKVFFIVTPVVKILYNIYT